MKCFKLASVVVVCVLLMGLTGCSSGSSFARFGYDFTSLGQVGVVAKSRVLNRAQQKEIADLFAMELLGRGLDVIDRANLEQLMEEAEFQSESGITSESGRAKLAVQNISAIVVVNVSEFGEAISMTAKMVEVESGSLLWMGEGTGDMKRGLSEVAGAIIGAGAGAAVGSAVHDSKGAVVGGVAGGLAGGVAGRALEPNQAKLARRVIRKMCRALPRNLPGE